MALELEALGPYVASLPSEMQNQLRMSVGDRSFGIPDGDCPKVEEKSLSFADLVKSKDFQIFVDEIAKRMPLPK